MRDEESKGCAANEWGEGCGPRFPERFLESKLLANAGFCAIGGVKEEEGANCKEGEVNAGAVPVGGWTIVPTTAPTIWAKGVKTRAGGRSSSGNTTLCRFSYQLRRGDQN